MVNDKYFEKRPDAQEAALAKSDHRVPAARLVRAPRILIDDTTKGRRSDETGQALLDEERRQAVFGTLSEDPEKRLRSWVRLGVSQLQSLTAGYTKYADRDPRLESFDRVFDDLVENLRRVGFQVEVDVGTRDSQREIFGVASSPQIVRTVAQTSLEASIQVPALEALREARAVDDAR